MGCEITVGQIVEYREDGTVLISAPLASIDTAVTRKYGKVMVAFADGRKISPEQRRKIYALIRDISEWSGEYEHVIKKQLKTEFCLTRMKALERKVFSLSSVDMNTASDFISYLIDFIVEYGVTTSRELYDVAEDLHKYTYACVKARRCCICGADNSDIHHVDAVGAGRDRDKISHIGMRILPLCRKHHQEIHSKSDFLELYHVVPIKVTQEIAEMYGLGEIK